MMNEGKSLGRSFSQALCERYCDFQWSEENLENDYRIVFFIGSSLKKSSSINTGLILHTSTVLLPNQNISHVGDCELVLASCSHVDLIDISSNTLSDWQEISLLLSSLPNVKSINFSNNPFPMDHYRFSNDLKWNNLLTLCLNGTFLAIEMVIEFVKRTPNLEELHICSNDYTDLSLSHSFQHQRIKHVFISKNRLDDWKSICCLGRLFPCLETLIASENPLKRFHSEFDENVDECFRNLSTLSVDQVQISDWNDIIALTKLPSLSTLRISSAPLLQNYAKDERFFLLIGYMKNLKKLNGTEINAQQRENSERRFIRYFSQRDEKPQRYFELIEKHGQLNPLVDILIDSAYLINVLLIFNQMQHQKMIDVRQTVRQFKTYLEQLFEVPLHRLRVFYIDDLTLTTGLGRPEELKYPQRFLHTYNIHDGDQFHIDLKIDVNKSRSVTRKKTTDRTNQNDENNIDRPFSFNSLQKCFSSSNQIDNQQNLFELDSSQIVTNIRNDEEDDDLLFAASSAWTSINTSNEQY